MYLMVVVKQSLLLQHWVIVQVSMEQQRWYYKKEIRRADLRQESLELIRQILQPSDLLLDEPMKNHTTFRAGGNAAVFLTPENEEQLSKVLQILREKNEDYYIF